MNRRRIPMSKSAMKRAPKSAAPRVAIAKPAQSPVAGPRKKTDRGSKQDRIITMLQSPTGTTVAAMMKEANWQQHSVRGFLAGVVRKKLKLKLTSENVDGTRIYRVIGADTAKTNGRNSKRRVA